ncbi:NB-ARC domain-containing protein [Actinokineospora sp. NPDC004072]
MGRPEKPVDAAGGAVAAFASELRALRAQAGNPTYRDMARAAMYSSSVLSSAASGRRLPTLKVALAFATACGGDRETWRRRWLAAADARPPEQAEPPARPGLPRPAQLPLRPRGLVGRDRELACLAERSASPVLVCGPVGVGKTQLALRHAHGIAAAMPDGQLYADLDPLPDGEAGAGAVLAGFLAALGVPASALPGSTDQRAALYRSLLAERRLVVLLDNVRDERQVRPLLVESRTSATVVVSRSSLPGLHGVRRLRVDVLSRADAVAVLAAAAGARAGGDPRTCAQLAESCGDLPLALDILARKLAARPHEPLHLVAGRVADPVAALGWLRVGDLSVWESLDSACGRLSAPAWDLLTRLARLPAEQPVWSCGRVDGSGEPVAGDLVVDLADAGLLRHGRLAGAFLLDRFVRAFALTAAALVGARELIHH